MAKRALCIGINDYPGTNSDLAGCVNDANDWAKLLHRRGFSVQLMLNREATGQKMRKALESLVTGAKKGERDGTDECLCPYDVRRNGPITDDELYNGEAACIFPGIP